MTDQADQPVILRTAPNEFQAGIIVAQLEDAGVEATTSAGDTHSLGVFGASGITLTHVWVRPGDVDAAEAALAERREESVDLDWSEVDVGEPDPNDRLAQRIARGERGAGVVPGGLGARLLLGAFALLMLAGAIGVADWVGVAAIFVVVLALGVFIALRLRAKYNAIDRADGAED